MVSVSRSCLIFIQEKKTLFKNLPKLHYKNIQLYAAQPVTKISGEAEKSLCPSKGHCMQYIPFSQMALIKTM